MKIVFKFIFLLSLVSNLDAQVLSSSAVSEIIKKVDTINNGQLVNSIPPMCINALIDISDNNKASASLLYNKCAVDLCGIPGKNPSVFVSDTSYEKFLSKSNSEKINNELPLIEKVVDKNLSIKKNELEKIRSFIENPQQQYLKFNATDKQKMNQSIFSNFIKVEVIKSGKVEDRISVKTTPPTWADDNFKNALDIYANNIKLSLFYNLKTIQNLKLSKNELKQHSLNLITLIEFQLKNNPKYLNENDKRSIESLKLGLNEKKTTTESLMWRLVSLIKFKNLMIENSSPISGGTLCDTRECDIARVMFLKQPAFTRSIENYNKAYNGPQSRIQSINRCKAGLISAEIEDADEKKTQLVYQEAIALIKANYVSKFSTHSKDLLEKYLTNSIITKAKPFDYSIQKINNVDAFKTKAEKFIKEPNADLKDSSLITATFNLVNDTTIINNSSAAQPCNDFGINIWDAFLSAKKLEVAFGDSKMINGIDHIYISPFTCQHSDHGKQVLAHEIGHALNSFFQYNKMSNSSSGSFKELRKCAKDQYSTFQTPSMPSLSLPGDSLLTEEDHADLISYMALQDKNIYTCSFLSPSLTDKSSYSNLDFKNIRFDSHSNPFTRVIFEAINKDIPLPQSCINLIQEVKPDLRLKKCI